jgi:hypothetical protein
VSAARRSAFLVGALAHFTLILLVCGHETLWLLKNQIANVPFVRSPIWETVDKIPGTILGDRSSSRNPWKQTLATYTNAAGIEDGYGYFAPNIPPTHALVFECHYQDGRVGYHTPRVQGEAAQLRLTTLLEQIGRTDYDPWRIELIKLLAQSTWREHPDALWLRAFFGTVSPPTLRDYRAGKQERTFNCLYVYDFRRETSKDE